MYLKLSAICLKYKYWMYDISIQVSPESMADEAVDYKIDWGVEDHEEVWKEDQDLHLVGRPPGVRPAAHDLVHVAELVDVQDDPETVFRVLS